MERVGGGLTGNGTVVSKSDSAHGGGDEEFDIDRWTFPICHLPGVRSPESVK